MNFLITGGTGFIGTNLIANLLRNDNGIIVLTRNPAKTKDSRIKTVTALEEISSSEKIDIIINLAGAAIDKRWTAKYKQILFDSRINTTKNIISLIQRLDQKPELLISASAIGYYGTPNGFTNSLCAAWETEALKAREHNVRVCITRLGVVLGNGGALKKMLPAFKLGLGGVLGDGKQMFSWVHISDVIHAFNFLIENKELEDIYNLTAPNPISNYEFTKTLGKILKRPTFFNMPAFAIKLLFGEMGEELLLRGDAILPDKLLNSQFVFEYNYIETCLSNLINY